MAVDLVEALKLAIERADPNWGNQPSHLRRRLDEVLGPEATPNRAQVHQLVVAAEERIPDRLRSGGWSPTQRDDLVARLVSARGWTPSASEWTVVAWAGALGLTSDRLPVPTFTTGAPPSVAAGRPDHDGQAALDENTVRPDASDPWSAVDATVVPDDPASGAPSAVPPTVIPGPDRSGVDFAAPTELPSEVVREAQPERHPASTAEPPRANSTPESLPVPKSTRKVTANASALLQTPLDVAYPVSTGASPALLLLVIPIALVVLLVTGFLIGALPIVIIALAWPKRILAVAGERVWVLKTAGTGRKPKSVEVESTRSNVRLTGGGLYPSVQVETRRVWFMPPLRRAARALASSGGTEGQ